ncbi:MAG: alpha/beta hydrolase [Synergistaceae bacterium]|jgi:esterase|nr:alpha/beta hydrolase [Synergistaceae bacterium]
MTVLEKKKKVIPYRVQGKGDRAIIFIHGFLDEGSVWSSVISGLDAAGFSIVTLDLPGMGALSEWDGPIGLRPLAAEVLGVLDEINKPSILVGHSMGAQIAEMAAVDRPGLIKGMALLTPIPLGGLPLDEQTAASMHLVGGNEEMQRGMRMQFSPGLDIKIIDELVKIGMKVKPKVAGELFDAWSGGDEAGGKPNPNRIPILIIGGDQDPFSPPELIKSSIAPRFSASDAKYIEGASHWPHVSSPQIVSGMINSFLKRF